MTDKATRQEKVEAALASLKDGISDLMESDSWTDWLRSQSRFHNYSFGNVMLITLQCPHATRVAGYRAWQAMGRQVSKGEKGLSILAPMRRTVEDEATGEKRSYLSGFGVVSVFDVSQTTGEPLPESPASVLTNGNGDEPLRLALVAQIESAGYSYADASADDYTISQGAHGYTDFDDKRVIVRADLPSQRVKTTAHELAHVLLHAPDNDAKPDSRALCEVEAESVAYVVCHALGHDTGDYSLGYVAGWSGGNADIVESVAKRVATTAKTILETLTAKEAVAA